MNGDGAGTANVMESDDKKADEEPQKKQRKITMGDASREMARMMTKSRSDDWLAGIFEVEQPMPTLRYSDVGGYSRQQRVCTSGSCFVFFTTYCRKSRSCVVICATMRRYSNVCM